MMRYSFGRTRAATPTPKTTLEKADHDISFRCAADALGEQPTQPPPRTNNVYQFKSDFLFSPYGAPPKVITIINLTLRSWSDELFEAEFYDCCLSRWRCSITEVIMNMCLSSFLLLLGVVLCCFGLVFRFSIGGHSN
jgi:hypothetical protein